MPLQHSQNLAFKAMITCPGGSIRTLRGDPNVKKASLIALLLFNTHKKNECPHLSKSKLIAHIQGSE